MKKILSIITAAVMIFCLMPPVRSFAADKRTVEYIDYVSVGNNKYKERKKTAECTVIDSATDISELSKGWYALGEDVSTRSRINISGDVHLILTDGYTLTLDEGMHLGVNNSLSIYGQSQGTGRLDANAAGETAIGGEHGEDFGILNIYGGMVNASAASGAAIGGGSSTSEAGGNGGTVNVFGGQVNADSSQSAAIGGGRSTSGIGGNGGTVNIYGGQVNADSNDSAAIGGGRATGGAGGNGGTLNVFGGEVIATADSSPAIGGGINTYGAAGDRGKTFISGGSVSACYHPSAGENTGAFDHIPTFGADYKCKVYYGAYESSSVMTYSPDNSIYTYYNYISIEDLCVDVDYVNNRWNGQKMVQSIDTARCIKLDKDYLPSELTSGWYVIDNSGIDLRDKDLNIRGNVHLIFKGEQQAVQYVRNIDLPKGSTLTLYSGNGNDVFRVQDITSSSGEYGTLTASSGYPGCQNTANLGRLNVYGCFGAVKLNCPDINLYRGFNSLIAGHTAYPVSNALSSVPKCVGFVPLVHYMSNAGNDLIDAVDPADDIYLGSNYIEVVSHHDLSLCDHSANTNPTCEGANCSVCGEYINPTGHKNGDPVIENETEAVCEIGGSYDEVIYCSVCGKELSRETKTVEAKGHIPAEPVIENQTAAVCTEGGSYDEVVYCSVCKKELSRVTKTTEALGHIAGDWEVISAPTTSSVGTRVIKCNR